MIIGIRREDKNEWEARVPLVPDDLAELRQRLGLQFVVQPSATRAFTELEFEAAGANISENLAPCDVILAVKEIPPHLLLPDKVYLFFSHTIKGQKYNLPMLRRLLELKATLIDYERIVDDRGRRLVFFGRFAGIAGMIDTFWALGQRLQTMGYNTPLAQVRRALAYQTLEKAKTELQLVGEEIRTKGLPAELTPLVVGFTGYGHVSGGAQEIFNLFPHEELTPADLEYFYHQKRFSSQSLYKVVFKEVDLVEPIDESKVFDLQDYYSHPEKYCSRFEKYLPYLSVVVNGIYWDARYPRLVTKAYLRQQYQTGQKQRLQVIGDISCDIEGSIECTVEATTPGNPVYVYQPLSGTISYGVRGAGPVILAVDNLPCELPRDSSVMFSRVLKDFIPALAGAHLTEEFDRFDIPAELKRATIVYRGRLTPEYQYLQKYLEQS
jgi:alpha-aminoadipic semialdehyde synthase